MKIMNKMLACLWFASLFGPFSAFADGPSLLKNGTFEFSEAPESWILFTEEPTNEEWVQIVESPADGGRMVRLLAGPPKRYISQDVRIEPGEAGLYALRWKAKGEGTGSASLLARDVNDAFFKPSFETFPATEEFESYEISVDVPEEAVFVRITIVAASPGSVIDFDELEFFRVD